MWRVMKIPSKVPLKSFIRSLFGWSVKDNNPQLYGDSSSARRIVNIPQKEHLSSLKSFLMSSFGWNGKDNNLHLSHFNVGGLNGDSSSSTSYMIKSLEKEILILRRKIELTKERVGTVDEGYSCTCNIVTEASTIFGQILESKFESEGEDFLRVDSEPEDLLSKLDIEELKRNYPSIEGYRYRGIVKGRILLFQQSTDIETRYKLMEFFAENEYGKDYPGLRKEQVDRDRAELDKILSGIVTYPEDDYIRFTYGVELDLRSVFSRYADICIGKGDKVLSKEERLALVKDDRGKTLKSAKKLYMNRSLCGWFK